MLHDDGELVRLKVFCPRTESSVPIEVCDQCAAAVDVAGGYVRCGSAADEACAVMAQAPPIGAVVESAVRIVRDSSSLSLAFDVVEEAGAEPVLVVDELGVCVGSLSRTELVRKTMLSGPFDEPPDGTVDEVMIEARVAVETASVRDVLRTMAQRRLRHLAVVATDGTPLGTVSDVEVLRLFAAGRRDVQS
ncbi:MAG: CBS domain-containing protein [Polyangiaceae bacterium]|nr:CBS domain-containing protein [Polyangiaceae bacterium]